MTILLKRFCLFIMVLVLAGPAFANEEEKPPEDPSLPKTYFINMPQFNTVAIVRGKPVFHMNFAIVLDMKTQEDYDLVHKKEVQIADAFVEELHGIASVQRGALLKKIDFVKQRLQKRADKVVGKPKTVTVLVRATSENTLVPDPQAVKEVKAPKPEQPILPLAPATAEDAPKTGQ
ncbi:MAG: hypothetical protein AB7U41_00840 [Dongiaceae bacterium]